VALALVGVVLSVSTATGEGQETAEPPPTTSATPAATDAPPATTADPAAVSEWTPLIDQEFDTPAALGRFDQVYPGWAGYDGYHDTAGPGLYDSKRVVSVADGLLNEHLHTADGEALVVSITPVPHVQTYGRYEVRFRSDVVAGYHIAWLLWPADNTWRNGEIDFPETNLDVSDNIFGFSHQAGGTDPSINQWMEQFPQSPHDWHTAVVEWRPHSLTFSLDGVSRTTYDPQAIPTVPMYWSMQTEADAPSAAAAGDVQIDYVKAWAYQAPPSSR
jgi:hypothetical protein